MSWFRNLSLTGKVVCMVFLLGTLAAAISLYSLRNLYVVERDYRFLLGNDAQAALLLGGAAQELSDASRVVFAVLTEQEAVRMRSMQSVLDHHQARFVMYVEELAPMLEDQDAEISDILAYQQQIFDQAAEIVEWAARWRGDRALNIIHHEFEPMRALLRSAIMTLHNDTVAQYQNRSYELSTTVRKTLINTSMAFSIVLFSVVGLAAYLSLNQISRPISQLTRVMSRLTVGDYPQRIDYTQRLDEVGQMARALEIFKDTMQKAERLEVAEQTAKAKAAFLATMSHEIRTPMNAILGLTRLALKHPLEPDQQERIEKIERAGNHLMEIISDILDFSKIDGGHLKIEQIPFSLGELSGKVKDMLESKAQQKGLSLHFEIDKTEHLLSGDPLRIMQILLNYINNAIKFSEKGKISVILRVDTSINNRDAWLYGEVIDQGIGIAEEVQKRLFTPFEQADASTSRRFGGTGLGLAITRSLAELMDGEVGVRSTAGQGSQFWFRVKVGIEEANESAIKISSLDIDRSLLIGLRVLLVDDSELNLLVASEMLQEMGLQVETADGGRAALELLLQKNDDYYDAVLLDLMMPDMDGFETCQRIRSSYHFRDLPVIALSANASSKDVMKCRKIGMDGHVAKPIDEQQLWAVLINCLLDGGSVIRTTDTERQTDQLPPFDPRPLSLLKDKLSAEHFERVLSKLVADCYVWREVIPRVAQAGQWVELEQLVHDMKGSAGHAGMMQLASQAELIRNALQDVDEKRALKLAEQLASQITNAVQLLRRSFTKLDRLNSSDAMSR